MSLWFCFLVCLQPQTETRLSLGVPQLQQKEGDQTSTRIAQLSYDIEVLGFLSQTTVTILLEDLSTSEQKATLLVQLPPQSSLDSFQVDIDDRMVDGAIRRKNLTRSSTRNSGDLPPSPEHIEWVGHDLYRIRVLSLWAKNPRTISFRYLAPLAHDGAGARYALDLRNLASHTQVSVSFVQVDGAIPPTLSGLADSNFTSSPAGLKWSLKRSGPTSNPFVFQWAQDQRPSTMISESESAWHFALRTSVGPSNGKHQSPPTSVALFWDASNSRSALAIQKEIDAVFRLVALRNPAVLHLIPFRDNQEQPMSFALAQNGNAALRQALEQQIYDGGTNLHSLRLPINLAAQEVWLFSDGRDTLGKPAAYDFGGVPVFAVSASADANHSYLDWLAGSHGGQALHWDSPPESQLRKLFQMRGTYPYELLSKQGERAEAYLQFSPTTPNLFAGGQTHEKPEGLALRVDNDTQQVLGATLQVPSTHHSWLTRFTAACQLDNLLREPALNRQEIISLGNTHGVVTPYTSLVVFETLLPYVLYRVTPPANAPFDTGPLTEIMSSDTSLAPMKKAYFSREALAWKSLFKNGHSGNGVIKSDRSGAKGDIELIDPYEALRIRLEHQRGLKFMEENLGASTNYSAFGYPTDSFESVWVIDHKEFVSAESPFDPAFSEAALFAKNPPSRMAQPRRVVQPWEEVKSALDAIAKSTDPYATYLQQKAYFGASPSFYYQTAHYFAKRNQPLLARRIATIF